MTKRKLRIQAPAAGACGHDGWGTALAALARELHAPDGVRFVPCVASLAASGAAVDEPWAGVVHAGAAGDELDRLRDLAAFRASLASCQGLWTLSAAVAERLRAWALPVPVAQIQHADTDAGLAALPACLATNAIYRGLPTPPSQAAEEFRPFDLTVLVCSYKRVHNIGPLLASLCEQTYRGRFEVIVWNNNPEAAEALEAAVAPFRDRLALTLIHSGQNYYCIVRLAVAHLMRSELLMVCDDDVQPAPGYLDAFVAGLREAGDRAVVCVRGNTFRPHRLDAAAPEHAWVRCDHLDFWGADSPPREIHFMHGSNCLIPRAALLEVSALPLPRREFILVDDYWLSYALSARLGWTLWKIRAPGAFRFDESAEDPAVALWLNARVWDQRTDFYVYHMTQGWPDGCGV